MGSSAVLTEDEVVQILDNKVKTKFTVLSYELKMLEERFGLCEHSILVVTIKLEDDSKNVETFFVKLYPCIESAIKFIEGNGAFRKEIFIYKLFEVIHAEIPILSDCIPKCYYTKPNKFIVLDNLTEDGYESLNKNKELDYDTLLVVLEAISKLHAASLIYEEKKSCRLNELYSDDFKESYFIDGDFPNKQSLEAAFRGVANTIQLFDISENLISGKNFTSVLETLLRRVFELVKPSKKFRNVVCHGDIWASNVLVRHGGKPVKCKFVDFQYARYTPPAQDVMALIYLTTSRSFRQKYMYNLIGIYYTYLERHVTVAGYDMKTIIAFDEFLASCEEQKVFGLVQAAVYFPLILLSTEKVQEYFYNDEAKLVDRGVLVRQEIDNNEHYKSRIRDCILDLKDYCDYL